MIGALNISLRGWFNYFKGAKESVFCQIRWIYPSST
ncbi:MAG: hypothetical protein LBE01_05955 [Deltaproteobacteria bacterium]|nr:hypothetical protein [Deltaproteobacteria bacterium]